MAEHQQMKSRNSYMP